MAGSSRLTRPSSALNAASIAYATDDTGSAITEKTKAMRRTVRPCHQPVRATPNSWAAVLVMNPPVAALRTLGAHEDLPYSRSHQKSVGRFSHWPSLAHHT